jgi:hypothetical protein
VDGYSFDGHTDFFIGIEYSFVVEVNSYIVYEDYYIRNGYFRVGYEYFFVCSRVSCVGSVIFFFGFMITFFA